MTECEYRVIRVNDLKTLTEQVNQALREGWVCQGGIAIAGRDAEVQWRLSNYIYAQAIDYVFAEAKGHYLALAAVVDCCVGPKALDELARLEKTLLWIQGLQRRLWALLREAAQPRQVWKN